MEKEKWSVIKGSGCYIPTLKKSNSEFLRNAFYDADGKKTEKPVEEIVDQFQRITGINERRYIADDLCNSDMAYFAAKEALDSSGTDSETLDYIIVAHDFGDTSKANYRSEMVPSLAARVKNKLKINNPDTVCYDIIFGCAGWLQAVIQADYYMKSGKANRILVIGSETLSRISDPHDRDSMIYADGAGAVILESVESEKPVGILSHYTQSITNELVFVLRMGKSNNPDYSGDNLFLKMEGRVLYENVLKAVPKVIKKTIAMAGLSIESIDKLLIHQANNKMNEAVLKRVFAEYGDTPAPDNIMPMTISWLGNSSVATLPTLYDLLSKGKIEKQFIKNGSNVVFASVGAGVNVNSVVYKVPG